MKPKLKFQCLTKFDKVSYKTVENWFMLLQTFNYLRSLSLNEIERNLTKLNEIERNWKKLKEIERN